MPRQAAPPGPATARFVCEACGAVTVVTVDPLRQTMTVDVPARRCRRCYPGGAVGTGGPALVFEAEWRSAEGAAGFAWRETGRQWDGLIAAPRPGDDADRRVAEALIEIQANGWQDDIALRMADKLGKPVWQAVTANWKVTHCEGLAAFAELLDTIYGTVQGAIATGVRVVVRWTGAPEIVAALAGELVARAVTSHFLSPLKGVAQMLRVAGAVTCVANGCAGSCACVQVLAERVLLETLKREFVDALDRIDVQPTIGNAAWSGCVATYHYLSSPEPGPSRPPRRPHHTPAERDPAAVRAPSALGQRPPEAAVRAPSALGQRPPDEPFPVERVLVDPPPVEPTPPPSPVHVQNEPFTRRTSPAELPSPADPDF